METYLNNKNIIYTALINNYDELKTPKVISKGFKYICFTDNPKLKSDFWEIKQIDVPNNIDPVRIARSIKIEYFKYLPHHKINIWVDSSFSILTDFNELLTDADIITLSHPFRDCVYQEAERCLFSHKDNDEIIRNQIAKYKAEGYPEHNGMISSGIQIRRNSLALKKFMGLWWKEIEQGSIRDQLSFNYVYWKNPLDVKILNYNDVVSETAMDKRFFLHKHKNLSHTS